MTPTNPSTIRLKQPSTIAEIRSRDAVVVIDATEFQRLQGGRSGQLLIDTLQASPHREIEIAPARSGMPVRDVVL